MTQSDAARGVELGAIFQSGSRTISEGDFTQLHNLTWTIGRLHVDKDYMAGTEFGERIMAGNLVMAVVEGLGEVMGLYDRIIPEHFGIDLVALLTYEDVRFLSPLQPGNTIRASFEITDARAISKPGRGIIKIKNRGFKDGDLAMMEVTQVFLFQRHLED